MTQGERGHLNDRRIDGLGAAGTVTDRFEVPFNPVCAAPARVLGHDCGIDGGQGLRLQGTQHIHVGRTQVKFEARLGRDAVD